MFHDWVALGGDAIEEVERCRVWSFDEVDERVWALSTLVQASDSERHDIWFPLAGCELVWWRVGWACCDGL